MNSGRTIVALLQKAADMAKEDCARAMDLAHKLSFQLRASEERGREVEAEAAHFRDRAARAEAWLMRIHTEVEQTFFQKKEREPRHIPRPYPLTIAPESTHAASGRRHAETSATPSLA